jgi:hypothetical protein
MNMDTKQVKLRKKRWNKKILKINTMYVNRKLKKRGGGNSVPQTPVHFLCQVNLKHRTLVYSLQSFIMGFFMMI